MSSEDENSQPAPQNVGVDPGELSKFAKFLDEATAEVAAIQQDIVDRHLDPEKDHDYGRYQTSHTALVRHNKVVDRAGINIGRLEHRFIELTNGTVEVSKRYSDLSDLNAANGASITTALETGVSNTPSAKQPVNNDTTA